MTDATVNTLMVQAVPDSNELWLQSKWRPVMAFMYMAVCFFDFILFPIGYNIVQFFEPHVGSFIFREWAPITLNGGGLFHVAMGAVLGVSAYGHTQERLAAGRDN